MSEAVITHVLLGVLSTAFAAWAVVVWRAAQGIISLGIRLDDLRNQVGAMTISLHEHAQDPAPHRGTATEIAVLAEKLRAMETSHVER